MSAASTVPLTLSASDPRGLSRVYDGRLKALRPAGWRRTDSTTHVLPGPLLRAGKLRAPRIRPSLGARNPKEFPRLGSFFQYLPENVDVVGKDSESRWDHRGSFAQGLRLSPKGEGEGEKARGRTSGHQIAAPAVVSNPKRSKTSR